MSKNVIFLLAACLASGAAAQSPVRPDPADPKATVASRPYESAFRGYRPYADPALARWRESNDEMHRLGGHPGHVRPATAPASGVSDKPPAMRTQGGRK